MHLHFTQTGKKLNLASKEEVRSIAEGTKENCFVICYFGCLAPCQKKFIRAEHIASNKIVAFVSK